MSNLVTEANKAIAKLEILLRQAHANRNFAAVKSYLQTLEKMRNFKYQAGAFNNIMEHYILKASKDAIVNTKSPEVVLHGDESKAGQKFKELEKSTMRVRKSKGLKRGSEFILRETSRKIYTSLDIEIKPDGSVDATANRTDLVTYHSQGADLNYFGSGKIVKLKPRPFVGLSNRRNRLMYLKLRALIRRIFV